jgi:signal transduction histidine kinase
MMRTVARNLITNAIKFTRKNGTVTINSAEEKNHFKIEIGDNGVGMDSETLNHLFRIDVNHKSLGTSNERGTGLGLIICKEFVEKNGGQLKAESKLEKGSKFSFTVPKHN